MVPRAPSSCPRRTARVVAAAALLLAAGCGSGAPTVPANTHTVAPTTSNGADDGATDADPGPPATEETGTPVAQGDLAPPGRASNAFTYDTALAPEGAHLAVYVSASPASTRVHLVVEGLVPERGYAVHAHANPCGATGDGAGPHFQNRPDPAATPDKPSTDPAYANPQNEIWLDLRTDGDGNGESSTEVPFVFGARAPASVVIHEAATTATGPGQAGSAGGRLACLTVPFR
jgi:superoxide dismutase, Cu-Zn family